VRIERSIAFEGLGSRASLYSGLCRDRSGDCNFCLNECPRHLPCRLWAPDVTTARLSHEIVGLDAASSLKRGELVDDIPNQNLHTFFDRTLQPAASTAHTNLFAVGKFGRRVIRRHMFLGVSESLCL
jgi:hypothetical protein